MTRSIALLLCALLIGCASRPPAPPPETLLRDELFAPPSVTVDAAEIFALSDDMRRFAEQELKKTAALRADPRLSFLDALYTRGKLGLSYDASITRTAAQAFDARAGNCLSLVIMTAAFARHLELPVSYRSVLVDDFYTREGDLYLASGHVNLVLDALPAAATFARSREEPLVVDFLPSAEARGQRSLPLREATIIAMFMNNRAAEALTEGRLNDSYAWAREAVRQDPEFAAAINTLAVIYTRAGHAPEAEATLRAVLARQPEHVSALSNLMQLLRRAGREPEAQALAAKLAVLQPYPPFHFFELGRQAMAEGDFRRARENFRQELKRQPGQHEVHFWAAQAALKLGDLSAAAGHLRQAMENSPTQVKHDLYAGKLDRLRATRPQ